MLAAATLIPVGAAASEQPVALLGVDDPASHDAFLFDLQQGTALEETTSGASVVAEPVIDGSARMTAEVAGLYEEFSVLSGTDGSQGLAFTGLLDGHVPLAAVVSDSAVDLSWTAQSSLPVEIFIDGASAGEVTGGNARLELSPGDYAIAISGLRETPQDSWEPYQTAYFDETGKAPLEGFGWSLNVTVPDSTEGAKFQEVAAAAVAQAGTITRTVVRHRAFIPDQRIVAPFPTSMGCTTDTFLGDDRDFHSSDGTHRMQFDVRVDYQSNGIQSYSSHASVDVTRGVFKDAFDQEYVVEAYAGTDDMHITGVGDTGTHAGWGVKFVGGDPFCANYGELGHINANYSFGLSRTLGFFLSGSHKPVPNHETYFINTLSDGSRQVYTAHLAVNEGFNCLVLACEPEAMQFDYEY